MTTSCSLISALIAVISLLDDATEKLPLSATNPTRAENGSISLDWSSSELLL